MNLLLPLLAAYALSDLLLRTRGRLGSGLRSAGAGRSDSWTVDGILVGLVYLGVVVALAGRPKKSGFSSAAHRSLRQGARIAA